MDKSDPSEAMGGDEVRFRTASLTSLSTRAAVPHSYNEISSPVFNDPLVVGMAATIGRASDASINDRRASPISLGTGIMNLEAGRRM